MKDYGYFCIITSLDLSSEEALNIYRRKDVIEKSFDDIKNNCEMKRLRTHNDATTDGKVFCAFLSLITTYLISNFLNSAASLKMRREDVFVELSAIKILITENGKRVMNPLTKTQRLILEACGLKENDVFDFVERG